MVFFGYCKRIFNKNDFDFDSPEIDFYKFHPQSRILLVSNGIFFNNTESYLRFFWPIISVLIALIASAFELMFIHHAIVSKDYSMATESFCYTIILTSIPVVYASACYRRIKIVQLLDSMNNDFLYICSLGPRYRKPFLEGQLIIWKLFITWYVFMMIIVSTYIGSTVMLLLYQSLLGTQTEYTERPLLFPMWLPEDDPYRTPNYEVFLFFQIIICSMIPQTFGVYVYVLFHTLLHHYYIMQMIECDFEVLFEGLDENDYHSSSLTISVQSILNKRIKRIVFWHNLVFKSIETLSSVYGAGLVYQVVVSSLVICLTAYQVAESLDEGKFHVIFTMLCIASCVQLWIPCYLGTLIRNKAFSIGDAAWNCGWNETRFGRLVKRDIMIIIMRSQKPVNIKFTGLPKLELETFSSIMSSSYSYFNILRQYK